MTCKNYRQRDCNCVECVFLVASGKAADEVANIINLPEETRAGDVAAFHRHIRTTYAPIESTYGLLVEIASRAKTIYQRRKSSRTQPEMFMAIDALEHLLADPQVRAAMEGMEK